MTKSEEKSSKKSSGKSKPMRGRGEGSIVQRGNRFLFRICKEGKVIQRTLKDPQTGKPAETLTEARAYARLFAVDIATDGRLGVFDKPDPQKERVPLSDLISEYGAAFSARWNHSRLTDWKKYMADALSSFQYVDQITHEKLGAHVQRMLDTPTRSGKDRSNANVNRSLAHLRALLNWAVKTGRIQKSPFYGFSLLREAKSRDRILSQEEISRLMRALENPRFAVIRPIVLVAVTCGLRRSEILTLQWPSHDPRQRAENILDLDGGWFVLQKTKSRPRKVPIPQALRDELAKLPRESQWVFPSPRGGKNEEPKPIAEIKKGFGQLMMEAKIEGCTFHDLRHCSATAWVSSGVDIRTIQKLLGHASIETTQRYLSSLESSQRAAVESSALQVFGIAGRGCDSGTDGETSSKPGSKTTGNPSGKPAGEPAIKQRIRRLKARG